YVEVAAGGFLLFPNSICHSVARRSDGSVVAWGANNYRQINVPAMPPGLTYVEIAAGGSINVARLGPPSTYVTFASGCAGSLPAARLVPLDTPRIGATLQVTVDNLPADVALLLFGTSNTSSAFGPLPLGLAAFGMPGCTLYASSDVLTLLPGSGSRAA